MKEYSLKRTVRAQQIKDSDFDNPHPNADHIIGVTYDPKLRRVYLLPSAGEGAVGDWVVETDFGRHIVKKEDFEKLYTEVDDSPFRPEDVGFKCIHEGVKWKRPQKSGFLKLEKDGLGEMYLTWCDDKIMTSDPIMDNFPWPRHSLGVQIFKDLEDYEP